MPRSAVWWAVLAVLCWGGGALFDKLALRDLPPKLLFVSRMYVALILFLAPMVLVWDDVRLAMLRSPRAAALWVVASVVFTYGGLYAYFSALSAADASKAVPFCAAYPGFAFLLAVVFLKEPFTPSALAGTVLVACGAYLLARP